jgi:hypothetical protein
VSPVIWPIVWLVGVPFAWAWASVWMAGGDEIEGEHVFNGSFIGICWPLFAVALALVWLVSVTILPMARWMAKIGAR